MVQLPAGGVVVKVPTSTAIAMVHIPATSALDNNKYIRFVGLYDSNFICGLSYL